MSEEPFIQEPVGEEAKDGIFRVKKERDYAALSNEVLRDKSLSFQARGVLCYLLSRPANWRCSIQDLINQSPAGKSAVYSTIKELEKAGYMKRIKLRSEKGQIKWVTEVYETPQPLTENQQPDLRSKPLADFPLMDNPLMDCPHAENRQAKEVLSKRKQNKEKLNEEGQEENTEAPLALAIRKVCKKGLVLSPNDSQKLRFVLGGLAKENVTVAQVEEFGRKVSNHWTGQDSKTKQPRAPGIMQVLENWRDVLAMPEPGDMTDARNQNGNSHNGQQEHKSVRDLRNSDIYNTLGLRPQD